MNFYGMIKTDEVTPAEINVVRKYELKDLLIELEGKAFDTLDAIIDADAGTEFAQAIYETYGDEIEYGELIRILTGPEAFELCGLNPDGSKNEEVWGKEIEEEPEKELTENVELIKGSAGDFDRMPDGFPTIVYTINEKDPDWEEKFNEIQNIVYDASNEIESYDIHLEGGFETPRGDQEIEFAIDPVYDDSEDAEDHEDDKNAVMELIDRLVNEYKFRKINFDDAEIENAVLPNGDIDVYDGDIGALRDELASTHDFEEPHEIHDYLEDAGFNVLDTDNGNGFEAWYKDPENKSASYIKFMTNQCWDPVYGPCCRLNESTFRIIHPKKTTQRR